MRAYFDTSAIVPLLIDEPATARCTTVWNGASVVVSSAITYVETHAALAQARRQSRLDDDSHRQALDGFAVIWKGVAAVPVTESLILHAAALSASQGLRGYDSVHCATARMTASGDRDYVAVSGGRDLLRAWSALGVATIDIGG